LVKPLLSVCVPAVLVLLVAFAAALMAPPTPALAADAKVQRLIFGSAGFTESNRFWTIARPEHLQYDPFLETLLEVDPKTGEFTPRLAEKWQASPDLKEWTFFPAQGGAVPLRLWRIHRQRCGPFPFPYDASRCYCNPGRGMAGGRGGKSR
jgi:hypothetical protein